jgi:hypothetical protein
MFEYIRQRRVAQVGEQSCFLPECLVQFLRLRKALFQGDGAAPQSEVESFMD